MTGEVLSSFRFYLRCQKRADIVLPVFFTFMNKKKLITIVSVLVVLIALILLSLSGLRNAVPDNPIQIHAGGLIVDNVPQIPAENNSNSGQGSGTDETKEGDQKKATNKDSDSEEEGENLEEQEEDEEDPDTESDEESDNEEGENIDGAKESDDASDKEGDGKTAEETPTPGEETKDPLIVTDLKNQHLTTKDLKNDTFGFYAYLMNNDADTTLQVKLRNADTSLKGVFLEGNGKNFSTPLSKANEGYNFITLYMKKNGEVLYNITYTIRYTEDKADAEHPEQGEYPPVIKTNLDGRTKTVKNSNFIFTVSAKTYKGKLLPSDHLIVKLDGKQIKTVPTGGGTYEYDLFFTMPDEGDGPVEHTVSVLAWDDEGNSKYIERKVLYEFANEGDVIGTVTVNVDVTTIGLGVIASGATYEIKQGEPASVAVVAALEEYGLTANYEGTPKAGFYLKGISGGYIANGARIPENLKEKLTDDGLNMTGEKSKNRIFEYDYTEGSGWVYTINGTLVPGRGISGYYLEDGDVLTLRFTLAYGKDLGGTSSRGLLTSYCGSWINGTYIAHHDMGEAEVTQEATCTEDGKKETRCKVHGCKECITETIPATGHQFEETERVDATYDADGYILYTCSKCGETKKEVIPKKTKPEDPTEPSEDPTQPTEDPTEPTEDPTEPSDDPTEPVENPTEPTG